MGLLTVDVTPLGIVMTSDSQPVDIYPDRVVLPADRSLFENHILLLDLYGFRGFASFVGTISIEGRSARDWLEPRLRELDALRLDAACRELAAMLSACWQRDDCRTWLSIFLAGYEGTEPRFWYVSNGGFPSGEPEFPRTFEAVNDLDDVWFPRNAQPSESKAQLIARAHPSFRRGVMPAAAIFESYTKLLQETIEAGHPQFQPIESFERYIAYTRFRFEFTKRLYNPRKGIAVDPYPPVRGTIRVVSIDPTGARREHPKDLTDVTNLP